MSQFLKSKDEMKEEMRVGRGRAIDPQALLDKVLLVTSYEVDLLLNKASRHCPLEDKEVSKLMKISMILNTTIKTKMDVEVSMKDMEEGTNIPKVSENQLKALTAYVRSETLPSKAVMDAEKVANE